MFELEKAIAEWRQQMTANGVRDRETLNELESHLRDDIERLMAAGLAAEQACKTAVEHIGTARTLKDEFAKLGFAHSGVLKSLKKVLMNFAGVSIPSAKDFTPTGQQALELARAEAPRFNHDFIGTEHVLLGLLKSQSDIVCNVMRTMGVNSDTVRSEIEKWVGVGIPSKRLPATIPYTPRALKALTLASREAEAFNQLQVSPEHIFLGLIKEGEGVAGLVLRKLGVDARRARDEIVKEMKLRKGAG